MAMTQWGLFSADAADWTESEAVEAGFWSYEEAVAALAGYDDEDELTPHVVEEPEEETEEELEEDRESYAT